MNIGIEIESVINSALIDVDRMNNERTRELSIADIDDDELEVDGPQGEPELSEEAPNDNGESNSPRWHIGPRVGKYWRATTDGSLHGDDVFENERCIEFISDILQGRKEFFTALETFKNFLEIRGSRKLSDVIYFNKSCGCHIHISIDKYKFWKKAHPVVFENTRKFFHKKVMRSSVLHEDVKASVLNHYDRSQEHP